MMEISMPKRTLKRLLFAALAAAGAASAAAQDVVAVLGSEQRAHRETFESFQASFGKPTAVLALGEPIPADAKIVLAFGGKAALQRYPGRVTVIYAIAPGALVDRKTHDGPSVKVMMEPDAGALLERLKDVQPKLKRLAVLWTSPVRAASAERLARAGAARGIEVSAARLEDADDLPNRLRGLHGKVDAIWLPPDPLIISAKNFEIIKHYSYDNDVPFYAPTEGLAEQGATAAVSVSYQEMGRMMAAAAKDALAGGSSPAELYTGRLQVTINLAAAKAAELPLAPEALKSAGKVLP